MLALDQLTLICIDTINQELALQALNKTLEQIRPQKCYFFTDFTLFENKNAQIELVFIEPLSSINDYNFFILKKIIDYVDTSHVLIIQYDGYVLDQSSWSSTFLDYDYIGAVWPFRHENECVGNGGFSLRSKKLLKALQDEVITTNYPEDDVICLKFRQYLQDQYDIKIAPKLVAKNFAVEKDISTKSPFGFHGIFNFHLFMTDDEILNFNALGRSSVFKKLEFAELIHNLYLQKRINVADGCMKKALENSEFPPVLLDVLTWHKTTNDLCVCGSGRFLSDCHLKNL